MNVELPTTKHGSSRWSRLRRRQLPTALLIATFLLWAGAFIWRTSFVVGGSRYFCLWDDAMISMTYARNLCEGKGLNWARQDEPVEGFTSPLWVASMIPANLLPIALRYRSLVIQLLSLAILACNVVAVRTLVRRHFAYGTARDGILAAALTAFYYPLNFWGLFGMETALQALSTTVSVLLALDIAERGSDRHLTLWGMTAAAYLLRMDMLVMCGAAQAYVVLRGRSRRPIGRRWLIGAVLFVGTAGGYELFRWLYFHDVLPNTYYLKMTGVATSVRLLKGLSSLRLFGAAHAALLAAVAIAAAAGYHRQRRLLLPAGIFLLCCCYHVYVGGDAWESDISDLRAGRFLVYGMPLVFVVLNAGFNRALAAWRERRLERQRDPRIGAAALSVILVLGLLLANGLVSRDWRKNWRYLALIEPPWGTFGNNLWVQKVEDLRRIAAPDSVVATAWAGIPAYFSDYKMIDLLGYNDRDVARLPSQLPFDRNNFEEFRPGHNKWDPWGALSQRPDAFIQTWGFPLDRLPRIMKNHGYVRSNMFWLRADSPRIKLPVGLPQ